MKQTLNCMFTFIAVTMMVWSCNNSNQEKNQTDEVAGKKTASTDSLGTIYQWGSVTSWPESIPIIDLIPIDHAFASDYSPVTTCSSQHYWNCLGGCHLTVYSVDSVYDQGKGYDSAKGNIIIAGMLVQSNCKSQQWTDNCTGGMAGPYAANGVCHQVSNRAAYATYWQGTNSYATPISYPRSLPGYTISHYLYGTYGQDYQHFKKIIDSMGFNSSFVGDNGDSIQKAWLAQDFGQQFANDTWPAYQDIRHLVQIAVNALAVEISKKNLSKSDYAKAVNDGITAIFQDKVLKLLGKEKFTRFFGGAPGKKIMLVDADH